LIHKAPLIKTNVFVVKDMLCF